MNADDKALLRRIGAAQKEWHAHHKQHKYRGREYPDNPPFPADTPCYYCDLPHTYGEKSCRWCINNPHSVIFEEAENGEEER